MAEGVFTLGHYDADPTGTNLSDLAWQEAYARACHYLQSPAGRGAGGAVIQAGPGIYTFTTGVVDVADCRIALRGAGKAATQFRTGSASGTIIKAAGAGSAPSGTPAAPVGGFSVNGGGQGGVTGISLGDRMWSMISDIDVRECGTGYAVTPASSSGMEGTDAAGLSAQNCGAGYRFDGQNMAGAVSWDYSRWNLHTVANGTALQVINGAVSWGSMIALHGNMGSADFPASTLLQIGADAGDRAILQSCQLHIAVEADAGSGTITDFVLQGADPGTGIINCYGTIALLESSGAWTAGSITGSRFCFDGLISGSPLVTASAGYKVPLGSSPVIRAFDSASAW